jgi:hypothetical protein
MPGQPCYRKLKVGDRVVAPFTINKDIADIVPTYHRGALSINLTVSRYPPDRIMLVRARAERGEWALSFGGNPQAQASRRENRFNRAAKLAFNYPVCAVAPWRDASRAVR